LFSGFCGGQLYRVYQRWLEKVFFQNRYDYQPFVDRGLIQRGKAERVPGSGVNLSRFVATPYPNNTDPVL